jgi:hypothetical protein
MFQRPSTEPLDFSIRWKPSCRLWRSNSTSTNSSVRWRISIPRVSAIETSSPRTSCLILQLVYWNYAILVVLKFWLKMNQTSHTFALDTTELQNWFLVLQTTPPRLVSLCFDFLLTAIAKFFSFCQMCGLPAVWWLSWCLVNLCSPENQELIN